MIMMPEQNIEYYSTWLENGYDYHGMYRGVEKGVEKGVQRGKSPRGRRVGRGALQECQKVVQNYCFKG